LPGQPAFEAVGVKRQAAPATNRPREPESKPNPKPGGKGTMENRTPPARFGGIDDALPLLQSHWAGESTQDEAAEAVAGQLMAMEECAVRLLPHGSRLRLGVSGGGEAFSAVLMKLLAGPGAGGLGSFDPSKGRLSGWVWRMMRNQVFTEARKAGAASRRLEQFKEGEDGEPLVGDGLLKAWDRRTESARASLAKEAYRQTIDRLIGEAGIGGPEASFLASLREGRKPTLREHAQQFGLSQSTLDRRRAKAVAEVDRSARRLISQWEESAVFGPMAV
jgi:hypothetical protein